MSFTCPHCGQSGSCWSQVGRPMYIAEGMAELARGHNRYEALRKLNPQQYAELWDENIRTGTPFDALVDRLVGSGEKDVTEKEIPVATASNVGDGMDPGFYARGRKLIFKD